jgi:hypothetical protein
LLLLAAWALFESTRVIKWAGSRLINHDNNSQDNNSRRPAQLLLLILLLEAQL